MDQLAAQLDKMVDKKLRAELSEIALAAATKYDLVVVRIICEKANGEIVDAAGMSPSVPVEHCRRCVRIVFDRENPGAIKYTIRDEDGAAMHITIGKCEHKWAELPSRAKGSYLKRRDSREQFAEFENDVEYTTLFCEKCGDTKEIVAIDQRSKK